MEANEGGDLCPTTREAMNKARANS